MSDRRLPVWFVAFVVTLVGLVLVSGVGVPDQLVQRAAASAEDPEQSVDGRPVSAKKAAKGAEESVPKVERRKPVWPKAGSAEVKLTDVGKAAQAEGLPVKVGQVKGADVGTVKVETLSPEAVRALGGVGIAARVVRADGTAAPGKVRAEFSYAGFRDAFGGNFVSRLRLVRVPACAVEVPRPKSCVARPIVVPSSNDVKAGTLVAEVEATPANAAPAEVKPPATPDKDRKVAALQAAQQRQAAQLAAGSVYILSGGMTGRDGNWGATDLKPAGTWQAGTSGGGLDYDVPLPEPPSVAGNGPGLSLQYEASSVDGQGDWTNNQSSVVGAGWDLSAGFIERRYRRCYVDNWYDDNTAALVWSAQEQGIGGEALCWESPDENDGDSTTNDKSQSELVLSAGGRSAQIVKDRTSGAWKTVPDLGWKIEQVAGGADGQPYWKITNQDGTVWRFGSTKDAQWQVPFVGNESGEPCYDRYYNDEIPPTCTGVWRWNLDQEIDRNENVVDYSYTRDSNYFCLPSCIHELYRVLPYDRGGFLSSVSWGHNTQVSGSAPTARMTFTTAARDGGDVPTDLQCTQATGCANSALAFYNTRKLTSVLTESLNPTSGEWDDVDRLDLKHTWVYQRTDFGPADDPVLWLDSVQQTGLAGGSQVVLPPLDFDAVMLAGKMDHDTMSDWTDLLSWRMVPRIAGIANGMGGRIEVSYGQADPCGGGKGRDGSNYFTDKTGDCYDVDYGSDPEQGYESWSRYYKQLAVKVVERDMVAGSPDMVSQYEFIGSPRWTKPIEFAEPGQAPPTSDWRGYSQVRTIEGSGSDPSAYSVTTRTFLRGTGENVTDFDGGTTADKPILQGNVLQEQAWKMVSLNPRAYTEVDSTRYEYTIQSTGNGPGTTDPAFVLQTRERSREKVTGGTWRYSDEKTAYNADGLPIKVNDYGQDGVAGDNSCTSTTYARNADAGQWLVEFPSVVEKRAGDDCTAGTLVGKSITLYDLGTDPATNKPSDGNATEVRSHANASTVSTVKATFDDYGRTLSSTDPLNKTTTTTYTPPVGWPTTGVTVTNPLGHTTTAKLSHVLGEPVAVTDPNGKTTEIDYDALGRTTAVWKPGQPRSGGTPSATATYTIPFDGWSGQPTAPIKTTLKELLTGSGSSAKWTTTHSYEDGLGRPREAQTASPAGGRIVTVTTYDPRGLTAAESEPVHNIAEPGSGLLNPALTSLPQWTKTVYDDQERPTAQIAYHLDTELRRTTTSYPGQDRSEVTPPVGGKTATVTDVYGRTVKVEEWSDATNHADTTYAYDLNNNLTTMTDANGNVRTYTHDWLDQRTAATDPDAGTASYGYDLAGQLAWSINGKGQKVSNTYDDLGRRTIQWSGEPNTGTKLAEWTYDTVAKGHPTAATRYTGGQPYTQTVTGYDNDYRPTTTKVTIPATEGALGRDYTFTTGYDAAGNLREHTLPDAGGLPAEKLTYSYTDLGFAKGLTSDLSGFTYVNDTSFTLTGKLHARSLGGNGKIKRTLERDATTDWLSRVFTQTKADTTTPDTVQDDHYSYNVAGNITRILDAASAVPGTTDGQSECFTYDGLLRLKTAYTTTASNCTGTGDAKGLDPYDQSYTYDKVGNITTLTDNGQSATYTYPTPGANAVRPNAVTAITRPNGTDTYAYDNAGQLTARTVAGKQATFDWDPLGQLTQATVDGKQTAMVYDADGQRLIRRDPDGSTTLYLGALELRLAGGQVTAKRYYSASDGTLVALRETGGGVTWLLAGQHGSTQLAISDTTGTVSRERYQPFGKRRGGDDLPFTDRGFLGKTEDASTDLTYLGARYYDPTIAKFISTDPELDLRTPEWANAYSYAANNPIDQSDPDGRRVDAGGGSTDQSYGYSRSKKRPNANQNFAKTHHASGKKKTAREREIHEDRDKQNERARKKEIEKRRQDANRKRYREDSLRKQADIDYLTAISGLTAGDDNMANLGVNVPIRNIRSLGIRVPSANIRPFRSNTKPCSSFVPGTKVLMADGSAKAIEDVKAGDKVIATDPQSGKTEPKAVTTPIVSKGERNLVRITVGVGDGVGSVVATEAHPFWVASEGKWVHAGHLKPGKWLRTSVGSPYAPISAISKWSVGGQVVRNLTVADFHTYYVMASTAPILVHNADCKVPISKGRWNHILDRHVNRKKFTNKSKFDTTSKPKIQKMINRALGGETSNGVYFYRFPSAIGRTSDGHAQYHIRVVVRGGKVITAFPSDPPE
ncbi:polymorphic toxin-type HINT domain-containing protein [Nonomuraea muscovyensis]|uniref:polymorphic toxin-type HINT domain-containing protein n=1 Tax=Nonomuraea muscovyensis TaxID=1124761 RepID=UPI0033C511E9